VKEFEEDKFIVMGSRKGVIKKTELSAFSNPPAASSRWASRRRRQDRRECLGRKGEIIDARRHGDSVLRNRRPIDGTPA
jgi:hypothetical protein